MITLYVTRHGKTVMNDQRLFQGTSDSKLNEEGLEVTAQLAKHLQNVKFEKAYRSPTGRTKQTAEMILENHNTEIEVCDHLIELHFGEFEGKNLDDAIANHPEIFDDFYNDPEAYTTPIKGVQPIVDFHNNVIGCLNDILSKHDKGNILIVCHGLVVRSIVMHALNRQWKDYWCDGHIPGASLTKIHVKDGKFDVQSICDTSYMSMVPTD